jgi:phage shock protein C
MTCGRCFKELEEGSAFCRFCGAAIRATATATPPRRLVRMPEEGRIAGVCAGIANHFDIDVTLVRLAWVILAIIPGLLVGGLIAYVAAWICMPVATATEVRAHTAPRLTRSTSNRFVAGVCGGLGEYLGIDATVVRLVSVALAIYPGAIIGGVIAYAIAWFIVPSESVPMNTANAHAS